MTQIPYHLGQVQWTPVQVPLNQNVSLLSTHLSHWKVPPPEVALFQSANLQKSPPINLLGSPSSTSSFMDNQASVGSPFDYEESYYTNMYRQLANRYNPQYKNKKPVHVAINQKTVNGLLSLLLLFVVSVCGSTGAVLIISSLTVIESLQTRNNCYLVSLALTNLFVTLFVIPTSALQIMTGDSLDGQKICHYQWLLFEHSLLVSQLSFFLMAADNYLGYQCSQKVSINAANIEEPNKLNQNFLLVCDHPLSKSITTTTHTNRAINHHQPLPAPSDTDVLLNNTTDLLLPTHGKGEFTRPGYFGYRFCCGRLKVPVWIICAWLIAVTCTLYQHESRYGLEFCSSAAAQSQYRLNTVNNLTRNIVQGIVEHSIKEPSIASPVGQQVPTLEDPVVQSRAARSISVGFGAHYYDRKKKNRPIREPAPPEPEVGTSTEDIPILNEVNRPGYHLSELLDDWFKSQNNIHQLEKPEMVTSLETAVDSCHRNKCKPDAGSRLPSRDVVRSNRQLPTTSRVGGEKTSIRILKRDSYEQQLLRIQTIKRADDSSERLTRTFASHKEHLQELVHHILASWFKENAQSAQHKKKPQSHTETDLNGSFMNNNNNNNDDNNVARMQIARERRTARVPMYIGPTNDGPSTYSASNHFSFNAANQQRQTPKLGQINRSHQVDQQLASKLKSHEESTTIAFLASNLRVKQRQYVDRSIGATSQLNSGNNLTTSGLSHNKSQLAQKPKQWLFLLTISSVTSLLSALLFASSYLKMKRFKMRPYKPMPVDAINVFLASLLSSGNTCSDSPCLSLSPQPTPEMTPPNHSQWHTQINTGRPTSALPPLDPLATPASYPTLRSVSQPCGPTPGLYGNEPSMGQRDSAWNHHQRRQLNQALSAPGGAVVCSSTYVSQINQQTMLTTRPEHNSLSNKQPLPVYPSVPVFNEQVGWQKAPPSAQMSQLVSVKSAHLPTLERHCSLPPQTRPSSSLRSRQDKKLDSEENLNGTIQYKRAKAIKIGADQLHVPGETNNNGPIIPRSASSPSSRGEPEVGLSCSNGAVSSEGKQYNRAIICTYSYMTDEQLLKSNIIAFVVSLTLWMPLILLTVVIEPRQPHQQPTQELKDFVWWMATLNCCSCSYVYALTNKDFREAFNKLFYYCCCKSHVTFQKKTPIFRRQLDMDSNRSLRVHIIPGLNQFSGKLSRPH